MWERGEWEKARCAGGVWARRLFAVRARRQRVQMYGDDLSVAGIGENRNEKQIMIQMSQMGGNGNWTLFDFMTPLRLELSQDVGPA